MTAQATRRQLSADGLLLLVTLIWGSTFVMVKDAVASYPVFPFLALRFGLATLALLPLGWRGLRGLGWRGIRAGVLIGFLLFCGYGLQTLGLQYTTASQAGFITGLSVVLVPLLSALVLRHRTEPEAVVGVVLATAGLALLTLNGHLHLARGDLLVLGCAISFALHIVAVSAFAPHCDPLALTLVQLATVTVLSTGVSLASGQAWPVPQGDTWFAAAFTGILATALAFGLQTAMQRFTTPTHTALIFAAEPLFAAMFGVWLDGDVMTTRSIAGGALIVVGTLVSEIHWSEWVATIVSRFVSPNYVVPPLLLVLGLADPVSRSRGVLWALALGVPVVSVAVLTMQRELRRGKISDWHISRRQERLQPVPVLAPLLATGVPLGLLVGFRGPHYLLAASLAGFAMVVFNLLVTMRWKISQHVSSIALGTTLLATTFGVVALPLLLLIPLVAWARVKVGAHTVMQTVVGGVSGVAITIGALHMLGSG